MNKEINKIIDNLESCIDMFDYLLTPTENNSLLTYIKQLEQQCKKQREFIKYLEDEIKRINPNDLDIGKLNLRLDDIKFTQYLIYKEILQKYKEVIGVSE